MLEEFLIPLRTGLLSSESRFRSDRTGHEGTLRRPGYCRAH
jgi:hypothetical protein